MTNTIPGRGFGQLSETSFAAHLITGMTACFGHYF
jgi:hypothetical protein